MADLSGDIRAALQCPELVAALAAVLTPLVVEGLAAAEETAVTEAAAKEVYVADEYDARLAQLHALLNKRQADEEAAAEEEAVRVEDDRLTDNAADFVADYWRTKAAMDTADKEATTEEAPEGRLHMLGAQLDAASVLGAQLVAARALPERELA